MNRDCVVSALSKMTSKEASNADVGRIERPRTVKYARGTVRVANNALTERIAT